MDNETLKTTLQSIQDILVVVLNDTPNKHLVSIKNEYGALSQTIRTLCDQRINDITTYKKVLSNSDIKEEEQVKHTINYLKTVPVAKENLNQIIDKIFSLKQSVQEYEKEKDRQSWFRYLVSAIWKKFNDLIKKFWKFLYKVFEGIFMSISTLQNNSSSSTSKISELRKNLKEKMDDLEKKEEKNKEDFKQINNDVAKQYEEVSKVLEEETKTQDDFKREAENYNFEKIRKELEYLLESYEELKNYQDQKNVEQLNGYDVQAIKKELDSSNSKIKSALTKSSLFMNLSIIGLYESENKSYFEKFYTLKSEHDKILCDLAKFIPELIGLLSNSSSSITEETKKKYQSLCEQIKKYQTDLSSFQKTLEENTKCDLTKDVTKALNYIGGVVFLSIATKGVNGDIFTDLCNAKVCYTLSSTVKGIVEKKIEKQELEAILENTDSLESLKEESSVLNETMNSLFQGETLNGKDTIKSIKLLKQIKKFIIEYLKN